MVVQKARKQEPVIERERFIVHEHSKMLQTG